MFSNCNAKHPYYCQEAIENTDTGTFVPDKSQVWGDYKETRCGEALLGGDYSVTFLRYGCGARTMTHEFGHSFGLHHSGTLYENGDGGFWGDASTLMGSFNFAGMIAPHIIQLSLDNELKVITQTEQILIAPLELSPFSLHQDEYQNIVIPAEGKTYHLSLRKVRGHAYAQPVRQEDWLYIHQLDFTDNNRVKRLMPDIKPGESKVISPNLTIKYLEYIDETARINVLFDGKDPLFDLTMPIGFPMAPDSAEINSAYTGAWYDSDFNGQGFNIQIKGDRAVLLWYTYNQKDTDHRFYYATCLITECLTGFDLYTTDSDDSAIFAGRAQFWFKNNKNGLFNYNTVEHGRGSVELTAIALSEHPLNGIWYQPEHNGEGFSLQIFNGRPIVFWYTQDQEWLFGIGHDNTQNGYDVTLYGTEGGKWMQFDDVTVNSIGTVKIHQNGKFLALEYTGETRQLKRLF